MGVLSVYQVVSLVIGWNGWLRANDDNWVIPIAKARISADDLILRKRSSKS